MKDATAPGFAALERNAKVAQEKTDALRKSLQALGSSFDPQHSLASQAKILDYTERQVSLRKQLALTTDADERNRITTELKALGLMKEQETLRKNQLSLQERLGKMQDATSFQAQASQEKLNLQALRNQDVVAGVALRNQSIIAKAAYAAQVEQERVDLRNIKVVADAKKAALREQERVQRAAIRSQGLTGAGYGLVAGLVAGQAGSGILAGLHQGAGSAADMEMAETTLGIATGANSAQLEGLRSMAFKIADQTAQSATDAMKNLAILAASGLNDPVQLRNLAGPIAQYADIQYYTKKTPFEESARQGVQLAHLFGALTADKMTPILEQLTKISFAMPDSLSKFLTQATYYEPVFRGLGVKDADALHAGVMMDRAGLGRGKGGTALQNLLLNEMNSLALTAHVQGKRGKALHELGLTDNKGASLFYKWNASANKNEFDIIGALKQIDKSVHAIPDGLTNKQKTTWQAKMIMDVNAALGLTGERAALAINSAAIANLDDSLQRIGKAGSMSHIQGREMGTLFAQEQRFKSNLDSLLTDLMWPWLDQLRGGFKWMGDEAHTFQAWVHTHKEAAKEISGGLALVGASLAIYSGVQLWGVASGLSGLSKAIKILGAASAVAEVETVGAKTGLLGLELGLTGLVGVIAAAALGIELIVNKLNPKFQFDNSHAGMLGAEIGWGPRIEDAIQNGLQRAFPAAFPMTPLGQGGQDKTIHIHGNVVVHANDPKAFAKAMANRASSATRHPVSTLNTVYSSGF